MSKSVTPPRAETITIVLSALETATMFLTKAIFCALATEVPPNFRTFSTLSMIYYIEMQKKCVNMRKRTSI